MGNTSSRKAPPLPWAPLCLGSRHCVSRCKGRRSRPPTVPEEEVGGEEVEGCGSLPVHVAVAAGITLGMCAQAAALPPLASSVLKGAAASIPLCAVVSAAVPVVRQKVEEAEEEEQRPLPDGATPSVTVWYQCTVLLRVGRWASEDWPWWAVASGALATDAILSSALPLATGVALSELVAAGGHPGSALATTSALLASSAALSALKGVVLQEAQTRLVVRLQRRALASVLCQETAFFDRLPTAALFMELGSVGSLRNITSDLLPAVITTGTRLVATLLFLSRYDATLAAICLVTVPVDYLTAQRQARSTRAFAQQMKERMMECRKIAQEMVQGLTTARSHGAVGPLLDAFWKGSDDLITALKAHYWAMMGDSMLGFVLPRLCSLLIFAYAGLLTRSGRLDAAELMTITLHQTNLMAAFSNLVATNSRFHSTMGQCAKGLRFLARRPQQVPRGDVQRPAGWTGPLELRDVSFRYAASKPLVLRGVSLRVGAGECVALVGPSGSGKTTVLSLLLALYDPTEGQVLVDGLPASQYSPEWFYGRGVAVVPQMPVLFRGSVRDNIAFGLGNELAMEEVEEAARLANAADFIAALPQQYASDVGQGGQRLSGGQRQRLALARAIVRRPGILLLDEATSALDAEAEHQVQQAIHSAMAGRTVVVVAHRLSTIRRADRIVVLEEGRVVEEGNFVALSAAGGPFTRLMQTQLQFGDPSEEPEESSEVSPGGRSSTVLCADRDGDQAQSGPGHCPSDTTAT